MTGADAQIIWFTIRIAALSTMLILPVGLALAWLLARRGIVAGALLAFARALGEFGATILVAGNIPGKTTTVSLSIYNLVQLGHDTEAFRLLLISVIIAFVVVWCSELFYRQRKSP